MDEPLLRAIKKDTEAKAIGRSAFVRRAVTAYLARKRATETRNEYIRGYREHPVTPGEMALSEDQAWPDE